MRVRWLLPDVVVAVHDALIAEHGGLPGIRDAGLLESALARPRNLRAYEKKVSRYRLAAAYAFGLAKNHPFIDGNKRVALVAAATSLSINGHELEADEAATVVVFNDLAAGKLSEKQLAIWLERNCR